MHISQATIALAFLAGVSQAQQSVPVRPPDSAARLGLVQARDSIRLSRRDAIALALQHNPQLEIARAQIGEAKARKVEAVSVPDPAATASLDQQPGLFQSNGAGQKNVGVALDVPFPNKLRLQGKVAQSDVDAAQYTYQ